MKHIACPHCGSTNTIETAGQRYCADCGQPVNGPKEVVKEAEKPSEKPKSAAVAEIAPRRPSRPSAPPLNLKAIEKNRSAKAKAKPTGADVLDLRKPASKPVAKRPVAAPVAKKPMEEPNPFEETPKREAPKRKDLVMPRRLVIALGWLYTILLVAGWFWYLTSVSQTFMLTLAGVGASLVLYVLLMAVAMRSSKRKGKVFVTIIRELGLDIVLLASVAGVLAANYAILSSTGLGDSRYALAALLNLVAVYLWTILIGVRWLVGTNGVSIKRALGFALRNFGRVSQSLLLIR